MSNKTDTPVGTIGTWFNGVPIYNYKDSKTVKFGSISEVNVIAGGLGYDSEFEPQINVYKRVQTLTGTQIVKNPDGVDLRPVVNGSVIEFEVVEGGSG